MTQQSEHGVIYQWCKPAANGIMGVTIQYFVEIHKLQTELGVFEAGGANFGTRCSW